jgi:hypothetical protein
MNRTAFPALAALAAIFCCTAFAQTQRWEYKSYQKDKLSGQYSKDRFLTATVSIAEKDGKATFRMVTPGRGDPCISRSDLPAEVVREADTMTITVTPELAGCEPFRYIIRNDGSGGARLNQRNGRWVPDGFDHGLTPKK